MTAQNIQQDVATPAYERVNGTSWWGSTIMGLILAASLLFTGASTDNNLLPIICLVIVAINYASLRRVGDNFIDRANRYKTLLGYEGFAVLFVGFIIWGKLTVIALPVVLFIAAITGIFAFLLAKFLLPSIQEIRHPEN